MTVRKLIYLDNCCFNRPYDDQTQPTVMIETLAKQIAATGIKSADSLHIACAITAGCDYLVTVDHRILKYQDNRIIICNPVDFINKESENDQ